MARHKKDTQQDEFSLEVGGYKVTKPADKYVVRLGGNVVYADPDLEQVQRYLDLVKA